MSEHFSLCKNVHGFKRVIESIIDKRPQLRWKINGEWKGGVQRWSIEIMDPIIYQVFLIKFV